MTWKTILILLFAGAVGGAIIYRSFTPSTSPITPVTQGELQIEYQIDTVFVAQIDTVIITVNDTTNQYNWKVETDEVNISGTCFGIRIDSVKITGVNIRTTAGVTIFQDSIITTPAHPRLKINFTPYEKRQKPSARKPFWRASVLVGTTLGENAGTIYGVYPIISAGIGIRPLPIEIHVGLVGDNAMVGISWRL